MLSSDDDAPSVIDAAGQGAPPFGSVQPGDVAPDRTLTSRNGSYPDGPATGRDWPGHTFLGRIDSRLHRELLSLGQTVRFSNGAAFIVEGATDRDLFVLLDGVCKVTGVTPHGIQALLAVRVGGDVVGELAAIDDEPRSATVTAAGDVLARRIGPDDTRTFLARHPSVAAEMNRAVAAKLRWSTRRRVDYGDQVKIRLARVLVELAYLHGEPVSDGIAIGVLTQPEIGALIGAGEPSVHKALALLRAAGVLSTRYRRIVIHDLDALGTAADGAVHR